MTTFYTTNYISSTLTQESELLARAATFINDFKIQTLSNFQRILHIDRDAIKHNELIAASMTNSFPYVYNDMNNGNTTAVKILWTNMVNPFCICATSSTSCSYSLSSYCEQLSFAGDKSCFFTETITLIGLTACCEPLDSFLQSSFACLYSHDCIIQIMSFFSTYLNGIFSININQLIPALDASILSQYTPNTKVIDIINELMIEQWPASIDYDAYFEQCRPTVCIYTITQQLSIVSTVLTVVGFVAGVSVVLRILSQTLVTIIRRIQYSENTAPVTSTVQLRGIVLFLK